MSVIPLRLTMTEALHLYAAEAHFVHKRKHNESLFGFCVWEDTPRLWPARYDLTEAIKFELLRLFAREFGKKKWVVINQYFSNHLCLSVADNGECTVRPRGLLGIVPTEFSMLRSELRRFIKNPRIEDWMLPGWKR
jgi:hypothetical protein